MNDNGVNGNEEADGNNGNINLDLQLAPAGGGGGGSDGDGDSDGDNGNAPDFAGGGGGSDGDGDSDGDNNGNDNGNAPNFPWATGAPAGVHTLEHLLTHGVASVEGETVCRSCERRAIVTYDLQFKYEGIAAFIVEAGHALNDRAPRRWMQPVLPDCGACRVEGCVRPVVAERVEDINWLFLFLGETLGLCKMDQLRWHCQHTGNHRTGAKNRLLYLSYLAICRQLEPDVWADGLGGGGGGA